VLTRERGCSETGADDHVPKRCSFERTPGVQPDRLDGESSVLTLLGPAPARGARSRRRTACSVLPHPH
jgi:hypothetical protein